jgi:ABC-type nitrate/sulfonate/bicarbonate transport system substrate-binding protein
MRANLLHAVVRGSLGIALGLVLLSLPAWADTKLVVGKANANADNTIPVNVGDQRGLFKKHGLDLKFVDFQGGSKMIQAMIAGNIDIAVGAGVEMSFIARGAPMMAVCESASTIPFLSVGIPWDSPIKSLKDLKGKKIGVSSSGSLTDWLAKQLAIKQGWGIDGIRIAPIGGSPTASMAAFKAHLIDADVGGTATFLRLAESKVGKVLAPASSYMGHIASGVIYASNKLIESNPDAVKAFVAGWLDTIRFIRANKAETVKIEMAVTKYSESVMSQEYDFVVGMYTSDCSFDPESLETLKQSFIDLKRVNHDIDMSKLYTEAFLPK